MFMLKLIMLLFVLPTRGSALPPNTAFNQAVFVFGYFVYDTDGAGSNTTAWDWSYTPCNIGDTVHTCVFLVKNSGRNAAISLTEDIFSSRDTNIHSIEVADRHIVDIHANAFRGLLVLEKLSLRASGLHEAPTLQWIR